MKRYFLAIAVAASVIACNNSASDSQLKDPSTVQSSSYAITDSTKLVNDSVIVPDTTPGNGRQAGKSDSIQKTPANDE